MIRFSKILSYTLTLMAILLLAACGIAQMEVVSNIEENFEGIEEIVVKGGSLEVTYEGSDSAEDVFLNAYLESNAENGVGITYKVEGKRLRVELKLDNSSRWGNRGNNNKGFISLTGPENMRLDINNSSGSMFISNVISDQIDLKISSGKIDARQLSSDRINVTASSGKIEIEGVEGYLVVKVSSGGGNISNIGGNVSLEASSGSYNISKVDGVVDGSLSSGSITLEDIQELGNLKVSSGRIKAIRSGLGGDTRFNGSSGSLTVQTEDNLGDYNFELSASSGSLEVGETRTGKKLNIDNGSDKTVRGSISSGQISIQN